jgi:CheY-like chemotaxis protein
VKVLVVDADSTRAPALTQTLRTGGAEVTVTPSGSFALTMLEHNRHDIVVSRARTEDLDGHELCAILKADPGTRDVRFVLVVGPGEVTSTETAAAGVDLVLPSAMMGSAIVPLILRLMQGDRTPAAESAVSPPAAGASGPTPSPIAAMPAPAAVTAEAGPRAVEPAPAVPRLRPEPAAPPHADPPRPYATTATAAAAAPWSKSTPPTAASAAESAGLPQPPRIAPPPPPSPVPVVPAAAAGAATGATAPPPVNASLAAPDPSGVVSPTAELLAMPSGTFQGSLEVMELADLTQAIAAGGKSGRLILALPQGGGLLVFEKGRVVHAEYRNTVGESAFGALLAACHGDEAGRFCFLPTKGGQSPGLPRTIDKTVDRLLLSSATAIDEKG